jgi:hypothetical protein
VTSGLIFFFPTGFYSPYRTLAFLNGLLDPQTIRTFIYAKLDVPKHEDLMQGAHWETRDRIFQFL